MRGYAAERDWGFEEDGLLDQVLRFFEAENRPKG